MRRLCALAFVLFLAVGCTAEDKAQWDEVWKDARGDNMQMRSGGTGGLEQPPQLKP
jgi:hypothetical protein